VVKVRNVILIVASALAMMTVVRGGHELPVYPSYYPHEIEIATVTPERAGPLLLDGKIHAYVGSAPRFAAAPPDTIQSVESLGSLVTVRINPISHHASEEASACAAVRAVARAIAANDAGVTLRPYPVTPLHGDYLNHVDLAEGVTASLLDPAQGAPSIESLKVRAAGVAKRLLRGEPAPDAWDVEIEETDVAALVATTMTTINGWPGPPELKSGWYHAYLTLGDAIDPNARERVEAELQRLQSGDFTDAVERINLERMFVAQLIGGCRKIVIGYTVKREYFNAEFSAGIENIGFDSHTGFNSEIFIRTVKLKDFPWNGWLALGIDARPAAAWNPVAGFTDPFGRLMWSTLGDPAMLPAPYGSAWMINRVSDVQAVPNR
jgi:hypothetical protein